MTGRIAKACRAAGVLVLAWAGAAWAGAPGTLQGRVVDDKGNRLAGVEVEVTTTSSSTPLTATTKKKGTFAVRVPDRSEVYVVRCRREGYLEAVVQTDPSQADVTFVEVTMARGTGPPPESPSSSVRPPQSPPSVPSGDTDQRRAAIGVFNEGVAAIEAGDQETAVARFQEAVDIDSTLPEPHRALAAIAMEREDFAAAAEAAQRLLELEPDDLEALRTVYFASVMVGDIERVEKSARQVLAADPASAATELMGHARSLFEQNLFELSRAVLVALTGQQPDLGEAHYLLGLCCNSLGDRECASDELTRFLEVAPDHPDATTARSLLEYLR
jgi:Flp pilus assembly protein TadD